MKNTLERLAAGFLPFIIIGVSIVLFIIGIVIFSYVLLIGALIGLVLFLIAFIRSKFVKGQPSQLYQQERDSKKGRVINHD